MDTLGRVPLCLALIQWGHLPDGEPWNPHTERKAFTLQGTWDRPGNRCVPCLGDYKRPLSLQECPPMPLCCN